MHSTQSRRRILLILPDAALGGGHMMNMRLADQLNKRGWTVDVVFLFDRHEHPTYQSDFPSVRQIQLNAGNFIKKMILPIRLAYLAKNYQTIIAGLDLAATNYGYVASIIARKPILAWVHIAFNEHMQTVSRLSKAVSLWCYKRIPYVVFPSDGAMESLKLALGGKSTSSCWKTIKNFHGRSSYPDPNGSQVPASIFTQPVILSIGRLSPQKSFERLIRIHAALHKRGIMQHLVILGEGPERAPLEALRVKLGVLSTCFLPGHVPNPRPWLEAATVFALCSRYEGLPLVLIEALQSGTPIAAMDCPAGPREILDDGYGGLLVAHGDEPALETAISRLLEDPTLRAKFSERGKRMSEIYDPINVLPRWEQLLTQINPELKQ